MKQLSPLIMALLLVCSLSASTAPRLQEHRRSYEDMTPAEIKAEVDSLRNRLKKGKRGSSGAPLDSDSVKSLPSKQAPMARESGKQPLKEPLRDHAANGQPLNQARVATENDDQPKGRGGAGSMRTVIKNGAAKIEQQRERFGQKEPDVVRPNPAPEPEKARREETSDDGMRVIELELPRYIGDRKNLTKKRVKIRAKPETIAIHKQILELDRMLIDDVVRMTGKPLQKSAGQKVKRR